MREYGKVAPQFWIGATGKALRGDPVSQVVALYLMTSPHASMTGVYHLPLLYLAHETGLPQKGASKGLQTLIEAGFCEYDAETETVFVTRMAAYQIAESLKPTDNRVAGLNREVEKMPPTIRARFLDVYGEVFNLSGCPERGSPLEAPPKGLQEAPPKGLQKPLPSQEQEQEQEQETLVELHSTVPDVPRETSPAESGPLAKLRIEIPEQPPNPEPPRNGQPNRTDQATEVFEFWRETMRKPRAQFTPERVKLVTARLRDGYTPADLKKAVFGCSVTPHNAGHNDRDQRFDDLALICRDGGHVDRFMGNADRPPALEPRR